MNKSKAKQIFKKVYQMSIVIIACAIVFATMQVAWQAGVRFSELRREAERANFYREQVEQLQEERDFWYERYWQLRHYTD